MSRRKSGRRRIRRAITQAGGSTGTCGRYEFLCHLGAGGMAEVFKARVSGPAGFRRDVVLKRLLASHAEDPEFVNMFTDEARVLGGLHHQNVVQALDFGEHDGQLFLVLEYVEGPSLSRVLRASGAGIPPAIAAYVAREVCHALDYVHQASDADGSPLALIHRDVTPSNIIVTPTGAVKLLDFGIAKFATALQSTRAGTVKGKSAYLAPEQLATGTLIDGRVDLFALGTVLHELLVGERLFAGDSDLASIKRILELKIPVPSSRRAGVPPQLDRIVMKALERNPERRYASAALMAADLDEVVREAHVSVSEVAAFVREVGAADVADGMAVRVTPRPSVPPSAMVAATTRLDLALPLRMWARARPLGRGTLVAGLGLALTVASALGFGLKVWNTHDAVMMSAPAGVLECQLPTRTVLSSTLAARPN